MAYLGILIQIIPVMNVSDEDLKRFVTNLGSKSNEGPRTAIYEMPEFHDTDY